MHPQTTVNRRTVTLGASALASTLLLNRGATAQEATPPVPPAGPPDGLPVAIHSGTCGQLSEEPVYDLGAAVTFGIEPESEGTVETIGGDEGVVTVVLSAHGTVDSDLKTLASDQGHAVVVYSRDEDPQIIACGNIAGALREGKLVIALAPVEPSTLVGIATLEETDDGQTSVTVYVFDTAAAEDIPATPPA